MAHPLRLEGLLDAEVIQPCPVAVPQPVRCQAWPHSPPRSDGLLRWPVPLPVQAAPSILCRTSVPSRRNRLDRPRAGTGHVCRPGRATHSPALRWVRLLARPRPERGGHYWPAHVADWCRSGLEPDPGTRHGGNPDPGSHGVLTLRPPLLAIPALYRHFAYFSSRTAYGRLWMPLWINADASSRSSDWHEYACNRQFAAASALKRRSRVHRGRVVPAGLRAGRL